jgi:hypothetical protein
MTDPDRNRPVVSIVHQMARTGGTLVNRCLGTMRHVIVLSEVHPLDPHHKIGRQAADWFNLLGKDDFPWMRSLSGQEPSKVFAEVVTRLAERIAGAGRHLVLRDWTHLDFLGVPFTSSPSMRLLTERALQDACELRQAFIVRHPLDQYASSASRPGMAPHLMPARFIHGYLAFAKLAAARGFQRYEDIARDPDGQLRDLCRQLQLPFDPTYKERWHGYDKITGDNAGPSRGFAKREIAPMPAMSLDRETGAALRANGCYRESLDLLGYSDDRE